MTIRFFDAFSGVIATVSGGYYENTGPYADPGSAPNEFISVTGLAGAWSMDVYAASGDVTMDDLTLETAVPEPATGGLLATVAAVVVLSRRRWTQE